MAEMKLWLLERIGDTDYDTASGFVVRASDAESARCEALIGSGVDTYAWMDANWLGCVEPEWGDPDLTTCVELTTTGPSAVILRDFRAG